jgi:hypothetical protein
MNIRFVGTVAHQRIYRTGFQLFNDETVETGSYDTEFSALNEQVSFKGF